MFAIVAVSLIPVVYCGIFNYASADDFAKSYEVHDVLLAGGNIFDALWMSVMAAKEVWETWEGTWASNFFLAFQPSIWGEHAYGITVPLCILYSAVGTGYILYEILIHQFGISKRSFWVIYWAHLFLFLQYMPYIRGGMFWYTGMAHYVMPMCFSMLMIAWMFKWMRTGKRKYYVFMLLDAIYIGGSHYQQIILVLLAILSAWLWLLLRDRIEMRSVDKRIHLLWIPFIVITIGLIICVLSPGNAVRGGEEFGFSTTTIALMPLSCVIEATRNAIEYIQFAPIMVAYAVLLWGLGWKYGRLNDICSETFRKIPAALVLIYLYLMFAATEAPAIYATGNINGISGGYYDIVYQCLILTVTIGIPLVAMRVKAHIQTRTTMDLNHRYYRAAWIACVAVLVLVTFKPAVKNSAAWTSYMFAKSGQLKDFIIQMEERIELLNDPDLIDIYVPEMNSEQGPFMHLQLSQDPDNYTNTATAQYYHKNTVTAVPREEYYERYSAVQGHDIPEEYKNLYSVD